MLMPRAFRACASCGGEGGLYARSNKRQARHRVRRPCKDCSNSGLVEGPMPEPRLHPDPADRAHLGTVAIAGGGIGGAATALALQQRGIPVTIYERDDNFQQRAQGYGLTMQQGATALMHLGIPNEGVFSHTHRSFLPDGTLLGEYGRAVHETTREQQGNGKGAAQRRNAHIPRQALRGRLLSALLPGTVRWGKAISRFDSDAGGVTLHFSDGSAPERASVLVGADGIWSTIRAQLLGHAPLRYLGVVLILGRAACAHPLADEQVFQTLDGDTRIYVMPFSTSPPVAMCVRPSPQLRRLLAQPQSPCRRSPAHLQARAATHAASDACWLTRAKGNACIRA
jgi:2-polyprenyl-6-methoxyphenol hydroxylase-like FAD-dependent oxidoreductase